MSSSMDTRHRSIGGHTARIGRRVSSSPVMRLLMVILIGLLFMQLSSPLKADEPSPIDISAPPGELVDIGTHRLYIYCVGHGSPTVILDAGLGGSSLEWLAVQQRLSGRTRVCAYDRAGYGWSDSGIGPRTSLQNAVELHLLLEYADIRPPYVLAGHSFGGYDVQLFASLYPKSIAGLVLVDSSHGGQVERFEAAPIGVSTAPRPGSAILISRPAVPANLPAELSATVAALMSSRKALSATTDELQHFRVSAHQVASAAPWPDVPVLVLTRGARVWPADEKGQLMESLWMQLQTELAKRSPHSLHIVVHHSGHHIHLDRPEVVAHALALLLDKQREIVTRDTEPNLRQDNFTTLLAAHTLVDDALLFTLDTSRTVR